VTGVADVSVLEVIGLFLFDKTPEGPLLVVPSLVTPSRDPLKERLPKSGQQYFVTNMNSPNRVTTFSIH